jgi:hypothetical protein
MRPGATASFQRPAATAPGISSATLDDVRGATGGGGGDGGGTPTSATTGAAASWRAKIAAKLAAGTPTAASPLAAVTAEGSGSPRPAPSPLAATAAAAAGAAMGAPSAPPPPLPAQMSAPTAAEPAATATGDTWRKAPAPGPAASPPSALAPPAAPLSKEEQNRLSAAAMRAELMGDAAKAAELRARVAAAQTAVGGLERYPLAHGAAPGGAGLAGLGGVRVVSTLDARGVPIPTLSSATPAAIGE